MVKDKFKLEALFQALDVPYRWENQYSLIQEDRTFVFDERGDIIKIKVSK